MVWRVVHSWAFLWSAFLVVASWWALSFLPTASWWFEAHSVQIADTTTDQPVIMMVDRDIHRPFNGTWTVTIRRFETQGPVIQCTTQGTTDYQVKSAFPEPLDLEWWTEGRCTIDEPGQYTITTTWRVRPKWIPGYRLTNPITSNVFTVYEYPPVGGQIYFPRRDAAPKLVDRMGP